MFSCADWSSNCPIVIVKKLQLKVFLYQKLSRRHQETDQCIRIVLIDSSVIVMYSKQAKRQNISSSSILGLMSRAGKGGGGGGGGGGTAHRLR